jgi:pilus assembly protein CpaB
MRVATIASLGGSALLGLGALVVAKVWLPHQASPHQAQAAAVAEGAPIVVAAGPLAYGTRLQAKNLKVVKLPPGVLPQGAYSSVAQVLQLDHGGAPVVLIPIAEREPILPHKLSGPGVRATVAAEIADGMRAYTIAVSDVAGGGGHVLPGDHVDVLATRDTSIGQQGAPGPRFQTDVVLQNVRVLGMDLNANPESDKPVVARTATLEVNVQDAGKLALAGQTSTLSLALRRPGSAEIAAVRPTNTNDLSSRPFAPPPAYVAGARRSAPARPASIQAPGSTIIVVNGDKPSAVSVPLERFSMRSLAVTPEISQ